MRAQVLGPPRGPNSKIRLGTTAGQLLGTWRGDQPVDLNDIVDVEVDARDSHLFDEIEIPSVPREGFKIREDDSVAITGRVVEVDHLDVMTLEVGGGLLSLEMEGVAPFGIVGTVVTLVVRDLDVHPTGI